MNKLTDEQILHIAESHGLVCQEVRHARDRVTMTATGRAVIATVRALLDHVPAQPPICADSGQPKHPGNCWNVRCQLGGTCCRAAPAHGVNPSQAPSTKGCE